MSTSVVPICRLGARGHMTGFQIEKRRARVRITLASGTTVGAVVFLADVTRNGNRPERVGDMLNADPGFFPSEISEAPAPRMTLFNRDHVVVVRLAEPELERELDASNAIAPRRRVTLLMTNGDVLVGELTIVAPEGHTRVSDAASSGERFRYVETESGTFVVNFDHVVEIALSDEPRGEG